MQLEPLSEIALLCQNSPVGKFLPNAFYVHTCALSALPLELQRYESSARYAVQKQVESATLIKFSIDRPKISYLFYPDFDTDPHPALQASIQVNLPSLQVSYRDYTDSDNPPILHRKETFVTPDYPLYNQFVQLTQTEIALGLLKDSRRIGTRREWLQRLREYQVEIRGHQARTLSRVEESGDDLPKIERHKAAIIRHQLSRPVRLALEAGLFAEGTTFFDYGCGYGGDIEHIAKQGYASSGWDPYYRPETPRVTAEIVNLGYVINVIEDPHERQEVLVQAWELTRRVLIVAAQVLVDDSQRGLVAYADGVITSRNTFQKYYEHEELKAYIDQVLKVDAIPVGLGVYFVFRDRAQAEAFRASRFRSRATTPRVRATVKRFEDYQELLAPLMAFFTERGRLPVKGELSKEDEIVAEFGNWRRAFGVVLQATNPQDWDAIAHKRRQDLKVYLALSRFDCRPRLSEFDPRVQQDLKALFGTYKRACSEADQMLFSLRDLATIAATCDAAPVGLKLRDSLLVHLSALETLDPLLRLYEGCASRAIGRPESATLVKFYLHQPKISYLFYPDFDGDPHPALHSSVQIDLRNAHVSYWEYDPVNPPILHRKEALVTPDYPNSDKFARLTRQEEDWGLLDDPKAIRHRYGWQQLLAQRCAFLKGYQLCWRKDADPYKLKLLKNQVQQRRAKRF